jgi:hypothetical protein
MLPQRRFASAMKTLSPAGFFSPPSDIRRRIGYPLTPLSPLSMSYIGRRAHPQPIFSKVPSPSPSLLVPGKVLFLFFRGPHRTPQRGSGRRDSCGETPSLRKEPMRFGFGIAGNGLRGQKGQRWMGWAFHAGTLGIRPRQRFRRTRNCHGLTPARSQTPPPGLPTYIHMKFFTRADANSFYIVLLYNHHIICVCNPRPLPKHKTCPFPDPLVYSSSCPGSSPPDAGGTSPPAYNLLVMG